MKRVMTLRHTILCLIAPALLGAALPLEKIRVPPGFDIAIYAQGLPSARSMALGDKGTLFVGTSEEKVFAVPAHEDGTAGTPVTLADGLANPNGVAFRDGALFVAETSRILRYDRIESRLASPPSPAVVYDRYPRESHHGRRVIRFGPDGMLYVPVGAPCNVCDRYGIITRLKPGAEPEVFARGVRNSVGYDWHPQTGELWFTDNGRDMLGDDVPPDELNHAPRPGMHFGFPYCHGGNVPDPQFGRGRACSEFVPPAQQLAPHAAALGMRFYTGQQFPPEYRNRIFIAEHGSWNRATKIGYRITMVTLRDNQPVKYEVFAEGWLQGDSAWGRPVDVAVAPDGALLVSDDRAGVIYRISYRGTSSRDR